MRRRGHGAHDAAPRRFTTAVRPNRAATSTLSRMSLGSAEKSSTIA
jgi:hypothetical protein